jgi:nicotinate phosphoribosyltransferase
MAYAYWKAQRIDDHAVFDLYFRKNPFSGEFTIFAGLSECLKFLENFHYSESGNERVCSLRMAQMKSALSLCN